MDGQIIFIFIFIFTFVFMHFTEKAPSPWEKKGKKILDAKII